MRDSQKLLNIVMQAQEEVYNNDFFRCKDGGIPFWMHGCWGRNAQDLCKQDYITEEEYQKFLDELNEAQFQRNDCMAMHILRALEINPPKYIQKVCF